MLKLVKSIFFGNYFIGFIAVALSVESCLQLQLPLNSLTYYIILFCFTVFYYTYAYLGPLGSGEIINPRKKWYVNHRKAIIYSQYILFSIAIGGIVIFIQKNFISIQQVPREYWLVIIAMLFAAILYYGLLPKSFFTTNLRNTGWLKAFTIGFVWACCVNVLSFIVVQIESGKHAVENSFLLWLFIKNFMFCSVNAIIFDIKDYADDSNKQLQTFVVRFGLRNTIWFILTPLIIIVLLSLVVVASSRHYSMVTLAFNLLPFILLLMITWNMQRPHKILYYLVLIDGLIFLKALCGIAGTLFIK